MALTTARFTQPQSLTSAQRDTLGLGEADKGYLIFNNEAFELELWTGTEWEPLVKASGNISIGASVPIVESGDNPKILSIDLNTLSTVP